jgi:hypothetical protein
LTGTSSKRGKLVALLLAPTAVAVAVGLLVVRLQLEPPTVPAFALAGDGGVRTVRRGELFGMTVNPQVQAAGAIGARAFLVRGDEVRPWTAPYSVALDGTVTVSGPVDVLFEGVPPGAWDVAIAVGRPETLPTAPRDILRARDAGAIPDAAWRLVRQPITIEE